jgi:acetyltransferase-like isoleucine patch superfamily enzyme
VGKVLRSSIGHRAWSLLRRVEARIDRSRSRHRDTEFRMKYEVGRGTYGTPQVTDWGSGARLTVGSFCSIASDVRIFLGGNHRSDWVTTYPFTHLWPAAAGIKGHPTTKGDVTIGHDVWIGSGALILSGVQIGNGSVIAANSVVTKVVRPYEVVAGNPAKHVRFRFSDKTMEALQQIAWWNWPDEKIEEAIPLLLSEDSEAFIGRYLQSEV